VAEQFGQLRLVVGADPFPRSPPFGFRAHDATVPLRQPDRPRAWAHQRYDRTRHAGTIRPQARLPPVVGLDGVAAHPGGLDEQISWATAERTAPDLACVIPVGYSVIVWIDGKEKVYGSIP
jgi:hypothetical protein